MIKELISLANHLDSRGYTKEADYLDGIIKKSQQSQGIYTHPSIYAAMESLPRHVDDKWIRARAASPMGVQASRALQEYNRVHAQNGSAIMRGINNLNLDSNLPSREERSRIQRDGTDEERQALRDSRTQAYTSAFNMIGRGAFNEIIQALGGDPRESSNPRLATMNPVSIFSSWTPIIMFGGRPHSRGMGAPENLSIDTTDNIITAMSGLTRLLDHGPKIEESNLPNDIKSAAASTVEKAEAALSAMDAWFSDSPRHQRRRRQRQQSRR
tara:strand:+ start:1267 stop:2076 length:810 start_codon:yes stop_codon:yes gene_type:complete